MPCSQQESPGRSVSSCRPTALLWKHGRVDFIPSSRFKKSDLTDIVQEMDCCIGHAAWQLPGQMFFFQKEGCTEFRNHFHNLVNSSASTSGHGIQIHAVEAASPCNHAAQRKASVELGP